MKRSKQYRIRFILSRPWQILKVLQDPEAWITNYRSDVYGKPFENLNNNGNHYHGNHVYSRHKNYNSALIFPSTWIPLRILHICAVAKVSSAFLVWFFCFLFLFKLKVYCFLFEGYHKIYIRVYIVIKRYF